VAISSLLLVTGAGASRDLGDQRPMPLMDDWCQDLITRFQEASLADAAEIIGLTTVRRPEDFEASIGGSLRGSGRCQLRGLLPNSVSQRRGAPEPGRGHSVV
jgi:hypothetical protein